MNDTCYLVAVINTGTLQVEKVGLFSEDRPTVMGRRRCATLASCTGKDYQEASDYMHALLRSPIWAWVQPLLAERDRRVA